MGSSASGAVVGGAESQDTGCQRTLEVEVFSRLGLQLSLHSEAFSHRGCVAQLPPALDATALLRVAGARLDGYIVYECLVAHGNSAPKEVAYESAGRRKGIAVRGKDLRASQSRQFLAVAMKQEVSLLGTFSLSLGAVYGAYASAEEAGMEAQAIVCCGDGERGLCSWRPLPCEQSDSPSARYALEVRKTEPVVLAQRSPLLDALERRSTEAATRSEVAVAQARTQAVATAGAANSSRGSVTEAAAPTPTLQLQEQQRSPSEQAGPRPQVSSREEAPAQASDAIVSAHAVLPESEPPTAAHLEATPEAPDATASAHGVLPEPPPATDLEATSEEQAGTRDSADSVPTAPTRGATSEAPIAAPGYTDAVSGADPAATAAKTAGSTAKAPASAPRGIQSSSACASSSSSGPAEKIPTYTETKNARRSAVGALALRAKVAADEAAEKRKEELAKKKAEELEAARVREEELMLRHTQDQEFQQSLLMDQLKDLVSQQKDLRDEEAALEAEVEEQGSLRLHAQQRLDRFGSNPRLEEECQRAEQRLQTAEARLPEVKAELLQVGEQIAQKNELLAAMLV